MVHSSIATALLLLAQIDNGSAQTCTYTLSSGILSWSDAKAACQSVGKQLASVQSAAQNALLRSKASGVGCWIGGTDPVYEGAWVWSPSNSPISYTNWANGEPGGGFCMAIQGDGYWNGANCASRKRYLCQSCTASGTICSNAPTVCDGTYSGSELCAPPHPQNVTRCGVRFAPPPCLSAEFYPGERARGPAFHAAPPPLPPLTSRWCPLARRHRPPGKTSGSWPAGLSGTLPTQLAALTVLTDLCARRARPPPLPRRGEAAVGGGGQGGDACRAGTRVAPAP